MEYKLTEDERALCIAALDAAAKTLVEGLEASIRMRHQVNTDLISGTARDMRKLSEKLSQSNGQLTP